MNVIPTIYFVKVVIDMVIDTSAMNLQKLNFLYLYGINLNNIDTLIYYKKKIIM